MGGEALAFNLEELEKKNIQSEESNEKASEDDVLAFAETMTPEQAEQALSKKVDTEVEQDIEEVKQLRQEIGGTVEDPVFSQTLLTLKQLGSQTFEQLRGVFSKNKPVEGLTETDQRAASALMDAYGGKKAFQKEAEEYARKTREELEAKEQEKQEASRASLIDLQERIKEQEEQKKITESIPIMNIMGAELMEQESEKIPEESGVREKEPSIETGEASSEEEREVLMARITELLGHKPRGESMDEIRLYEFSQPIKLNDPKLKEKMEARRLLNQLKELEMEELDEGWEMPQGIPETLPMTPQEQEGAKIQSFETLRMTPEEEVRLEKERGMEILPTIAAIPATIALGMERSPSLPETLPMESEVPETLSMEDGMDAIQSLREAKKQSGTVDMIRAGESKTFNQESAKTKWKGRGILGVWGVGKVIGWSWKGVMGFLDGMQKYILRPDLGAGISQMFRDIKARFNQKKKE